MIDRSLPFVKWFPARARESHRWRRLTLEQKGFFHELYDWAATLEPRGTLVSGGVPLAIPDIAWELRLEPAKATELLKALLDSRHLAQNEKGVYFFPDFKRHQRQGPLRVRESEKELIGTGLGQLWDNSGAQDVEEGPEEEKTPGEVPAADVPDFILADGTSWRPTAKLLASLKSAFPKVNLANELHKAATWCVTNKPKRKTRRGIPAFLNRWMRGAEPEAPESEIPSAEEVRKRLDG